MNFSDTAPASDDRDRRGGFDDRRDDRRGGCKYIILLFLK